MLFVEFLDGFVERKEEIMMLLTKGVDCVEEMAELVQFEAEVSHSVVPPGRTVSSKLPVRETWVSSPRSALSTMLVVFVLSQRRLPLMLLT